MRRSAWRPALVGLFRDEGLFGRFAYLVLTQGVVVALGLAYWTLTARTFPAGSVGLAAAGVSAATLVSALGGLGVGSVFLAELRGVAEEDRRAVIGCGVLVVGVCSGLLALVMVLLSPVLGHNLRTLGREPVDAALLVLCSICTGIGILLDAAAVGMRRSVLQLFRNAFASVLRIGLVAAAVTSGARSTESLFLVWVLALGASLCIWPWVVHSPGHGRLTWSRVRDVAERYRSLALHHHVLNLAITSVTYSLPAMAALFLVAKDYAYFSVAQLVSSTALLLPALLAMSLFAEATGDEALLSKSVRRTLPVGFACCIVVLAVLEPAAPWVLSLFGHAYAAEGATTLRLLLLGGLAYVVKDHYVGIRRAQRRMAQAARTVSIGTGTELAAAAIGAALFGVRGLCAFWVVAAMCEAAFFAPAVWKVAHRDRRSSLALE